MTVPRRLSQLLELAEQGPTLRAALAEEVAELLTAWPANYPPQMRAICETLLARAARDADAETRTKLRLRLKADPELAARVLPREAPGRDPWPCTKARHQRGFAMRIFGLTTTGAMLSRSALACLERICRLRTASWDMSGSLGIEPPG